MRTIFLIAVSVGLFTASQDDWRQIWDGKSLKGWHVIGKGQWTIEGDAIVGRHSKKEEPYGHLVTDATFKDFTVRLRFKSIKGNSGLYFRIEEKGFSGVSGFQAEIDPVQDVGGLYETNGRGWVVQPTAADLKKFFKPGDWNTMVVSAYGDKLKVTVNGVTTADITDKKGRQQGKIALQVHGGQDVEVYFKDIEIKGAAVSE